LTAIHKGGKGSCEYGNALVNHFVACIFSGVISAVNGPEKQVPMGGAESGTKSNSTKGMYDLHRLMGGPRSLGITIPSSMSTIFLRIWM